MQNKNKRSMSKKLKTPDFKDEAEEARWYAANQNAQVAEFRDAARNRTLRRRSAKIITDPVTGLPVLRVGKNAPVLASKHVDEMLADFP